MRTRILALAGLLATCAVGALPAHADPTQGWPGAQQATSTPIKHLVVIFQENVSFDHYFDFHRPRFGGGNSGTLFLNESTGEPVSRW